MGYILTMPDTNAPKMLGVEVRRESLIINRDYNDWPPETPAEMFGMPEAVERNHGLWHLEISKVYLCDILAFFDNPANREKCGLEVPPPYDTAL